MKEEKKRRFMLFKLKKIKQDNCHELVYMKTFAKKTLTWIKLSEECSHYKLRAI